MKRVILLFFSLICLKLSSQVEFSFFDVQGNKFVISNPTVLKLPLDSTFIKGNFHAFLFTTGDSENVIISISHIKKKKHKLEFDLRLSIKSTLEPISIKEALEGIGYSHYLLKLKRDKENYVIDKITFVGAEI